VLLVAIQAATYGDDIDIQTACPECEAPINGVASIENALSTMSVLQESYKFKTYNDLYVEIKPFSYETQIKAGIANFKSTRSLQILSEVKDELEQLKLFNQNFIQIAALNFELMVDSVASVQGTSPDGEEFIVTDRKSITEFLENCESSIGTAIEQKITEVNAIGINKKMMLECESCHHEFEHEVGFDPVNFFTASLPEPKQKKS
jgi:rubredoxin